MLKFVRQGESGRGLGQELPAVSVVAAPELKDGDHHDCTVCKTRRRSLDRQAASVLRRSRSRETLRSIGNTSSNEDDTCIIKHAKMSQHDNGRQVVGGEGGSVWRARGDKYRRLSRSCETLSMSNEGSRWRRDDTVDEVKLTRNALSCRMRGQTVEITERPLSRNLKKNETESIRRNGRTHCLQTVTTECETKQPSVKESRYMHGQRWKTPLDKEKSKQVQFGGVEYEKSKEESVMGRLRNAVSGHRRKLRSRSLERVDRRYEWNPETGEHRDSWTDEENRRSRFTSWRRDELIAHPVMTSEESGRDIGDKYEHQQLLKNYKRRSRSRSKECIDRSDGAETRQGKKEEYRYDNQNVILTPASWQNDNFPTTKSSCSDHYNVLPDAAFCTDSSICDMQSRPTDNHRSAYCEFERTFHPQRRNTTCTLISPQYKAPNGHYGNAVVRKCPKEQKHVNKVQTCRNTFSKSTKLGNGCRKGDAVMSSEQGNYHLTRQHVTDKVRRSSVPKLEKCGISALKIAKLDTPLKITAPDLSIIKKITDVPNISIISNKDAANTSQQSTEILLATSSVESRQEDNVESTIDNESCSSGYVYNCTTSKITKLSRPVTNENCEQLNSKLAPINHTGIHISSITKGKPPPSENKSNPVDCHGEIRKTEATNNLVRQASVASLSLISVNSVDSGTSCHEGSTTDSSSDKEIETQGKTSKQRLGKEARQYTASAKELENLILASCFGKDKYIAGLVTSDYDSDTGPEMVKSQTTQDGRRGASRVVRFVGSKDDIDVNRVMKRNQQSKQKGQAQNTSKKSTANTQQRYLDHSTNNHLLTKLTVKACVLHNHKAMSRAEMSVQKGDAVYLTTKEFEQRPLWVRAYSICSGESGLIPSVYLGTDQLEASALDQ